MPSAEPPPPRRVVTGHDADGHAVIVADGAPPLVHVVDGGAIFHELVGAAGDPVPPLEPPSGGAVARIIDLPPGFVSSMHRTKTVDYGIILSGEIVLIMGGGEERVLHAGDVVVQYGTDHQWINRTDTTVRTMFVLIDAV